MEIGRFGHELYKFREQDIPTGGHLIIGRGTKTDGYVCVDAFGGAFDHEPHLWMDFNSSSLKLLPDDAFDSITVDSSTWRYLKPNTSHREWWRILKHGGRLIFEHGIASFGTDAQENPCHLVWTPSDLAYWNNRLGQSWNLIRRIVIPAPKLDPLKQAPLDPKLALWTQTLANLEEHYRNLFKDGWILAVHHTPYPIQTKWPIYHWIELKKVHSSGS
ncbi:hypothetical protein EDD86DRAFT_211438 [Gorgonomyces haynaldii]|nr:hypothetical protein EDD86DRAFT_211438 [Gorgonomyces haynaldii]